MNYIAYVIPSSKKGVRSRFVLDIYGSEIPDDAIYVRKVIAPDRKTAKQAYFNPKTKSQCKQS